MPAWIPSADVHLEQGDMSRGVRGGREKEDRIHGGARKGVKQRPCLC